MAVAMRSGARVGTHCKKTRAWVGSPRQNSLLLGINSEHDAKGEWFVFVHYLSKCMDWFDTLWIVLKKNRQQLSFLHVYHHATISMVWGHLLYSWVGNGTIRYGAWINSLTHVIMYSHYLWTSFGFKNPFKRYITMWQIRRAGYQW